MLKFAAKKQNQFALFITVISTLILTFVSIAHASLQNSFQFTTATGRAAITENVTEELARVRALEDALYLAALQGGAKINGFSAVATDTSVQDHFVIRPSSKILDYTILSENKIETQMEVTIRAAVGKLPDKKCQLSRPLNLTLYKPKTSIDMNVPAWIEIYHPNIFNEIVFSLNKNSSLSINNAMSVTLSPEKLRLVDEKFDYSSLMSPQVRVRTGDYAIVPILSLSSSDTGSRFSTSRKIEMKLGFYVFDGGTYELFEKFEQSASFEVDRIALFQSLADLDKKSRNDLIVIMMSLIEPLNSEMITTLGCQTLKDTIYLNAEQLTAQIGSNQGVKPNMLAVTSGKHTPWTMLRVVSVSANYALLEPLDKARKLSDLDGKKVEFMEFD